MNEKIQKVYETTRTYFNHPIIRALGRSAMIGIILKVGSTGSVSLIQTEPNPATVFESTLHNGSIPSKISTPQSSNKSNFRELYNFDNSVTSLTPSTTSANHSPTGFNSNKNVDLGPIGFTPIGKVPPSTTSANHSPTGFNSNKNVDLGPIGFTPIGKVPPSTTSAN